MPVLQIYIDLQPCVYFPTPRWQGLTQALHGSWPGVTRRRGPVRLGLPSAAPAPPGPWPRLRESRDTGFRRGGGGASPGHRPKRQR